MSMPDEEIRRRASSPCQAAGLRIGLQMRRTHHKVERCFWNSATMRSMQQVQNRFSSINSDHVGQGTSSADLTLNPKP